MVEDDGKPKDASVPQGNETDTPTETPKENLSELDKIKADNIEMETALIKGRELRKEALSLEAEKQLAGTTGGKVVEKEPEKISDEEYADKFMKGEANPLGEDGISLN